MSGLSFRQSQFSYAFILFCLIQTQLLCYQYKVGDLDSWGIPTSANPNVYINWSKYNRLKIGDSLLFLYPPSQDSVIQVTKESYYSCNLKDPILYRNNGNSLFNITTPGEFYFTSGAKGHCEKSQKLPISVPGPGDGSSAASPAYGPSALSETAAPSYPVVFGSIPMPPSSSTAFRIPVFKQVASGILACVFACGRI